MANDYNYGRNQEQKVARSLRGRGAKVKVSPGSKSATDLDATFPSGTRWKIQVKATRSGKPPSPAPKELGRLKQSATKCRATPVVANVSRGKIKFESARTRKPLTPPKGKR